MVDVLDLSITEMQAPHNAIAPTCALQWGESARGECRDCATRRVVHLVKTCTKLA